MFENRRIVTVFFQSSKIVMVWIKNPKKKCKTDKRRSVSHAVAGTKHTKQLADPPWQAPPPSFPFSSPPLPLATASTRPRPLPPATCAPTLPLASSALPGADTPTPSLSSQMPAPGSAISRAPPRLTGMEPRRTKTTQMKRRTKTRTAAWTYWPASCTPCSGRPPAARAALPGPCCRLPSPPSWSVPLFVYLFYFSFLLEIGCAEEWCWDLSVLGLIWWCPCVCRWSFRSMACWSWRPYGFWRVFSRWAIHSYAELEHG